LAGTALTFILEWSIWRRYHQAIAKLCHWKRHAKRRLLRQKRQL